MKCCAPKKRKNMKLYFDQRWGGTCPMCQPPPPGCASSYIMIFCSKFPTNHRRFQGGKKWSFQIAFPVIFGFCQYSLQQTKFLKIFNKYSVFECVSQMDPGTPLEEMNTFSITYYPVKIYLFVHYHVLSSRRIEWYVLTFLVL